MMCILKIECSVAVEAMGEENMGYQANDARFSDGTFR
jgi:hypothetical protein